MSAPGERVLGWILDTCKLMEPCETERDMALNNFAKELLKLIYGRDDGTMEPSLWEKIKKLFKEKR